MSVDFPLRQARFSAQARLRALQADIMDLILDARRLLLVVRGAEKAAILHQALTGPVTTQCPASVLQLHPYVMVLADEAAAALLSPRADGTLA
ncbi:6-phosphogluconolactonase [uncultured Arthrobacter sp.]|uniref:6-phosphogluconolactonase n=1 Tax=uncultured Arthrobacter sp. TaxID=114050 RepID=UPI00262D1861|nr:6-phosphogluconolactonase [uncultured Arthrobacter sp.]